MPAGSHPRAPARRARSQGFTYLGVLLAIALVGLGLSGASELWSTTAQRQRMQQLEFVGQQYVQAIGSYYEASPQGLRRFPASLDDLLLDRRFPFVRRHLRQAYRNPLTGQMDWELVLDPRGGVRGVATAVAPGKRRQEFVYTPLAP